MIMLRLVVPTSFAGFIIELLFLHLPNYCWHVDGNDKLKPFGFPIHGAVDGYSRRVLWLYVDTINNDLKVMARYFVDC